MSESTVDTGRKLLRIRKLNYRGRGGQTLIYLGKMLRMFVYQSDWKVLPMAALIAGIVSMVVRKDFFLTMEGTLKGALALTCLSIWNGCFNSIQVVCRERDIIKREHRSGLHISAYILSHMLYQSLLCIAQTVITLYVCRATGIQFPKEGLFTPWLIVDLGITIFLITYASDMLSLWVSCLTRSTTTAMTIMPFVLIFQLVFSGGIFTLPVWANSLAALSISNYGMKCIAAQSNYNDLPLVTAWNTLEKISDQDIDATVTLGQVFDFLSDDSKTLVKDIRERDVTMPAYQDLMNMFEAAQKKSAESDLPSVSNLMDILKPILAQQIGENPEEIERPKFKLGEVIDFLAESSYVQEQQDLSYSFSTTLGQVMDTFGRDKLRIYVEKQSAAASRIAAYETTKDNINDYWIFISLFAIGFALLSVISLEFVDKDKR